MPKRTGARSGTLLPGRSRQSGGRTAPAVIWRPRKSGSDSRNVIQGCAERRHSVGDIPHRLEKIRDKALADP